MTSDDGGPAYPFGIPTDKNWDYETGMSKREEFAKAAMHAWIVAVGSPTGLQNVTPELLVRDAYVMADLMLAESRRERENGGQDGRITNE